MAGSGQWLLDTAEQINIKDRDGDDGQTKKEREGKGRKGIATGNKCILGTR